jgi:hypothetical protein
VLLLLGLLITESDESLASTAGLAPSVVSHLKIVFTKTRCDDFDNSIEVLN